MIVAILGCFSNSHSFFDFFLRTILLAVALSFGIFLFCGKVYSCSAGENYIVMEKRKRFSTDQILISLRNIRDNVFECEDSESELDDSPYPGKDVMRSSTERVSDRAVMQLMRPYLCKGTNVTTDSYFTCVKITNQLKGKQASLLGTVNKISREVPLP